MIIDLESLPTPLRWSRRLHCAQETRVKETPCAISLHFVNNAVDAMEGEGKLWLSTAKNKRNCSISVRDNGIGMDEETQKKIFDPFFTTKEPGKGTGLGLHVVNKIVEKHGAKLTMSSQLGIGTTFTISFPLVKDS